MIQLYRGSKHSCCDNLLHCQNQPRKVSSHASQYNIRRPKTFYLELMANRHTGSMFLWPEQLCTRNTCIMIHLWWFMYHDMTWWDMTSRCVAILLWLFSLHWTSLCCTESVMLHCVTLHRTYIELTNTNDDGPQPNDLRMIALAPASSASTLIWWYLVKQRSNSNSGLDAPMRLCDSGKDTVQEKPKNQGNQLHMRTNPGRCCYVWTKTGNCCKQVVRTKHNFPTLARLQRCQECIETKEIASLLPEHPGKSRTSIKPSFTTNSHHIKSYLLTLTTRITMTITIKETLNKTFDWWTLMHVAR